MGAEVFGVPASAGKLRVDALVNCAGLDSDRIARLAGLVPAVSRCELHCANSQDGLVLVLERWF